MIGRPARATPEREPQVCERVVAHMRSLIEAGKLRPGDRLAPERALAAELGVSRPSLRSALRTLSTMRMIESRHGAGTFVCAGPPTFGAESLGFIAAVHHLDRDAIDEAGRALEASIASLAAEHATEQDLTALSDRLAGMTASLADEPTFAHHEQSFRSALIEACHNPILGLLARKVAGAYGDNNTGGHLEADARAAIVECCRQIVLAIRDGDSTRAHSEANRRGLGSPRLSATSQGERSTCKRDTGWRRALGRS